MTSDHDVEKDYYLKYGEANNHLQHHAQLYIEKIVWYN